MSFGVVPRDVAFETLIRPRDLHRDVSVCGGPKRIVAELPPHAGAELLDIRAPTAVAIDLIVERHDRRRRGA
jgi:hypothetical protein